jgi:hypothetical protein
MSDLVGSLRSDATVWAAADHTISGPKTAELERRAADEIVRMQQEIDYLRHYGNKDCTHLADEALQRDQAKGYTTFDELGREV